MDVNHKDRRAAALDAVDELGKLELPVGTPAELKAEYALEHTRDERCPLCCPFELTADNGSKFRFSRGRLDVCRYTRVTPMEPIGRKA